VLTAIRYFILN